MSDYGDMEKVGPIGKNLPRNDEDITTEAGDIILYQGNSLVIYYDTNSWNFTRLGKMEGMKIFMIKQRRFVGIFGLALVLAAALVVYFPVHAAKKAGLSQAKMSVTVGEHKTLKLKNISGEVSWKILSGKGNIELQKKKSSVIIKGKKAGNAKVQAKVAGRKYVCKVSVKAVQTSDGRKIKVQTESFRR